MDSKGASNQRSGENLERLLERLLSRLEEPPKKPLTENTLIAILLVGSILLNGLGLYRMGYVQARHDADVEDAREARELMRDKLDTLEAEGRTMGSAWQERIKRDILRELREEGH